MTEVAQLAAPGKVRWWRILLGGFLAELALLAIAVPAYLLPNGATLLLYVIPPACLIATLIFGYWVARKAEGRFILHGVGVGVVAALLYVGMTWGQTLPVVYLVSHFLKVIGGAAGGFIAQRANQGR